MASMTDPKPNPGGASRGKLPDGTGTKTDNPPGTELKPMQAARPKPPGTEEGRPEAYGSC
jgi:hypothetical protein